MPQTHPTTEAASVRTHGTVFQADPGTIRWRLHFRSPPEMVHRMLASADGRRRYWAESAEEHDGTIHFVVPGGLECDGRVLENLPGRRFTAEYFGWTVRFDLEPDDAGTGTDLTMTCTNLPEADRMEITAGWVSVLMAMKAAVDHGIDLRNHDPARSWWQGYADN